jgi:hypothetical protein
MPGGNKGVRNDSFISAGLFSSVKLPQGGLRQGRP